MMRNRVLGSLDQGSDRPTALDVGCGPGLVMELFSPSLKVKGVDIDPEMVRLAKMRGMDTVLGDAENLPFEDGSFDLVYCSFTMLWVNDPGKAMAEMVRVARRYVVCLGEPDYGGRISHPEEIADLDQPLIGSLIAEGADPFIGRKLGRLMEAAGLEVESGVHSGIWSPERMREEAESEWASLVQAVKGRTDEESIKKARSAWDRALTDGSLFLFNPVFYAVGKKR